MIWPSPHDFNDAVRNPAAAFTDPDLAGGDPVIGPDGRPHAHTGEFSAVYQVCAEDGRSWAVKCFNRLHDQRAMRYAAVRAVFTGLPFAVPFEYLADGVRTSGRTWPVLKMNWVEGLPLNQVAGARADSPAVLDRLFKQWVQLARDLRAARIAHGDLQHANVLLVPSKWPGAYTLKLIDYDAMYLPELADAPSYETSHANYRHPARNERSYSPDLDRFPLLVVATALKALAVRGPLLWKRYGAKDNMLFTAADFQNPAGSSLMRRLWRKDDAVLRALVGKLALACLQPLSQTPWLDELVPEARDPRLTAEETRAAEAVLGGDASGSSSVTAPLSLDDEPAPAQPLRTLDEEDEPKDN